MWCWGISHNNIKLAGWVFGDNLKFNRVFGNHYHWMLFRCCKKKNILGIQEYVMRRKLELCVLELFWQYCRSFPAMDGSIPQTVSPLHLQVMGVCAHTLNPLHPLVSIYVHKMYFTILYHIGNWKSFGFFINAEIHCSYWCLYQISRKG